MNDPFLMKVIKSRGYLNEQGKSAPKIQIAWNTTCWMQQVAQISPSPEIHDDCDAFVRELAQTVATDLDKGSCMIRERG